MGRGQLVKARESRSDEFYTRESDIGAEFSAYPEGTLEGKAVYCPCDLPGESAFPKFFADNFSSFGLSRVVCSGYVPGGHGKAGSYDGREWVTWDMAGDGSYCSAESTDLAGECDFIATNPPFSLMHGFSRWLLGTGKGFSVIAPVNCVTYPEVFPAIRDGECWAGATGFNRGMFFRVPEGYGYAESYHEEREVGGEAVMRVSGVCWLTTVDYPGRHREMHLESMGWNLEHKPEKCRGYRRYDRYDAIDVPWAECIPSDYYGVFGVPVTALNRLCPEQFEILGCSYPHGRPSGWDTGIRMKAYVGGREQYKRLLCRLRVDHRDVPGDAPGVARDG